MHSSGVPIGVQVAARPAADHVVLQVAAALEVALPWRDRIPPLHVSKVWDLSAQTPPASPQLRRTCAETVVQIPGQNPSGTDFFPVSVLHTPH
jgi:hypothetical protein